MAENINLVLFTNGNQLQLRCDVTESYAKKYILESSSDGINYAELNQKDSKGNGLYTFTFNKEKPNNVRYFRVKQILLNGNTKFSNIVKFAPEKNYDIVLYPHPASSILHLQANLTQLNANIQIINSSGHSVYSSKISTFVNNINIATWASGVYYVNINRTLRNF